jgi:hypothetical protein
MTGHILFVSSVFSCQYHSTMAVHTHISSGWPRTMMRNIAHWWT